MGYLRHHRQHERRERHRTRAERAAEDHRPQQPHRAHVAAVPLGVRAWGRERVSWREWVDMSSHWADLLLLAERLSIMIVAAAAYQAGWSSCSRSLLKWRKPSSSVCMVKRSENGVLGAAWLQGHGLSVGPEVMGRSS